MISSLSAALCWPEAYGDQHGGHIAEAEFLALGVAVLSADHRRVD
jgi:hypothetical protein